jgi:hypothetical protein
MFSMNLVYILVAIASAVAFYFVQTAFGETSSAVRIGISLVGGVALSLYLRANIKGLSYLSRHFDKR